jgi:hypothetical protein
MIVQAVGFTPIAGSDCLLDGVPTLKCAEYLFQNLLIMSSAIILLILFIMFIIGGFNYLTSFGNPEKVKKAQGTLRYAVIGVVVYMSAFLILKTIDAVFLGNCGRIFKFQIGVEDDQQGQPPCPAP